MAVKDRPAGTVDNAVSAEPMEPMEWSPEEEIQLFTALRGLKPIGINKHFYMACICERLATALKRDINPDEIWAHLHSLYNLKVLDAMETLPFPQHQQDFALPADDVDLAALMALKLRPPAAHIDVNDDDDGGGGSGGGSGADEDDCSSDRNGQLAAGESVAEVAELPISERSSSASPVVKSRTSTPQPQTAHSSNVASIATTITTTTTTSTAATKSAVAQVRSSVGTRASTPNPSAAPVTTTAATSTGPSTASSSSSTAAPATNSTAVVGSASATAAPTPSNSTNATPSLQQPSSGSKASGQKELLDKKLAKLAAAAAADITPKRPPKRTRGSKSIESNSPSTTPPPTTQTKRRRI